MSKIRRRGLLDRAGTLAARVPVEKRLKNSSGGKRCYQGEGNYMS